jgi:hypothetical protein
MSSLLQICGKSGLVFSVLVVALFGPSLTQGQACDDYQSPRSLTEAVTPRSWDALYRSFSTYRNCDDGAVGEGFSESVARILADHWDTLPRLAAITKKDLAFRRFVMRHIDATLDPKDVEKIGEKANRECPTGLGSICNQILKQADAARKQIDQPPHS